jgi:hypothetical protein
MKGISRWWISCSGFTIKVITRDGLITEAPPYVRAFIGQPLKNLEVWARRNFEGVEIRELY